MPRYWTAQLKQQTRLAESGSIMGSEALSAGCELRRHLKDLGKRESR